MLPEAFTGASRGLGQHLSQALAGAGAGFIIMSRQVSDLKPFQSEIEKLGRLLLPLELDVRTLS